LNPFSREGASRKYIPGIAENESLPVKHRSTALLPLSKNREKQNKSKK
jgi:hypothetical protein